ncbi:hypothetical protein LCGC14_1416300 [marine sediment metagenome]|uniref:STAS domain-containing protein n=1 Tax=marine sediment metagenome TaxID=412755 RepID=A0A0F9JT56_9ZZZZ
MPLECRVRSQTPELVLFVYGRDVLSRQDIDTFSAFFNMHLHGDTPFKVFFDLRRVDTVSLVVVKSIVKSMISYEKLAQGKIIATSVLVGGTIIENLLHLLFSIREPTTPTKVTTNLEKACNFLNEYDCLYPAL